MGVYCKLRILSKHWCLFLKLADRMSAYNHGVLIFIGANKHYHSTLQLYENKLAVEFLLLLIPVPYHT